jgi:transcriptional regulator with XRE-family HTH domain
MRPVRIYLLLCSNKIEWVSSVHRDLDEILAAWEAARKMAETVGIVHVGISRPPNSAFGKVASGMSDCVVLTTSARWVFDEVGTYSDVIDYADGLGLHVALSGWGHANPDLLDIARSHQSVRQDETRVYGSPWLMYFDEINPNMAREAWSLGVRDDTSYCEHEQSLHWDMRHALGTARMDYLMRTRDFDNPIQVATSCPPWLIDTPLELINATVRCANSLRSANMLLVADLLQMTTDDLLKIPNFGRKSLNDLAIALRSTARSGPILKNSHNETYQQVEKASDVTKFVMGHKDELQDDSTYKPPSWGSFKLAFESNKSRLKENQASVLSQRIGTEGEKMTLEEISEKMGITRERVRQIEAGAIEIFRADGVWESELVTRLDDILREREDPLPAQSLGIFDPWFADVENMIPEFKFILDRVLDDQFFLLEINGCRFVTRISKNEWCKAVREGILLLERAAQDKISKANARRGVEELLLSKGAELASELWATTQTMALFAKDEYGTERVVGVGTGAESLVAAVLAASDRPLHFTEIPKCVQDAFGRSVEVRRAHNAARIVGLLFGRGTFGTLRHCPLTPEEMDILRQEAEEIILSGSRGRQWTCFELVEKLGERALDFEDRINRYVVHIALHSSSVLSNLGRFVWTQSGERPSGTQDRIDITQATLSVLQSAGRPMTKDEIRAALLRDRGLTGCFQIHPRGSLVRTSAGCWGILERDIPLSYDEIRNVCSSAAMLLESDQCGMHLTEIKERLRDATPEILRVEDPYAIFSALLTDPRFKISTSGYIYLVSWDGPRRLSQGDAVVTVLRQMKERGIKASDLAKRAAEILGRPVEKENVYTAMVASGAKFDEDTGRWTLHEGDESEAEIDEDAGV